MSHTDHRPLPKHRIHQVGFIVFLVLFAQLLSGVHKSIHFFHHADASCILYAAAEHESNAPAIASPVKPSTRFIGYSRPAAVASERVLPIHHYLTRAPPSTPEVS